MSGKWGTAGFSRQTLDLQSNSLEATVQMLQMMRFVQVLAGNSGIRGIHTFTEQQERLTDSGQPLWGHMGRVVRTMPDVVQLQKGSPSSWCHPPGAMLAWGHHLGEPPSATSWEQGPGATRLL